MGNTIKERTFEEMIATTFVACNERLNDWMHVEAIITPLDDSCGLGDVAHVVIAMQKGITDKLISDIKDGYLNVCPNALIRMVQIIRRARDINFHGDDIEELKSTWDELNDKLIVK